MTPSPEGVAEEPVMDKPALVTALRAQILAADAVFVVDHFSLNTADLRRIRDRIRPSAKLTVVKNSLLRRALSSIDVALPTSGPTALLLVSGDVSGSLRSLGDAPVRAGYERTPLDAEACARIRGLPTREAQYLRLATSLNLIGRLDAALRRRPDAPPDSAGAPRGLGGPPSAPSSACADAPLDEARPDRRSSEARPIVATAASVRGRRDPTPSDERP